MPITLLSRNPELFLPLIVAIIIGITFHEFSHVLAAYLQGDSTGKDMGRLTLNPFRHIDPLGLGLLIFAGFGWGRPAPFNPNNLRNRRFGTALVAIAGPLSNLVLIVIFGLLFRFALPALNLPDDNLLVAFLAFLIQINIVLMIFNLIPIPPLDGSRVLLNAIPDRHVAFKESFERYGPFLLIFLVLFGGGLFSQLFRVVNSLVDRILS